MTKFISKWKHLIVVIEPQKLGRIDGETKRGKRVEFWDFYADVHDEGMVNLLKESPGFGVDYWLYDEPTPAGIKASSVPVIGAVETSPAAKEMGYDSLREQVAALEGKLSNILLVLAKSQELAEKPKRKWTRRKKVENNEEAHSAVDDLIEKDTE